MENEKKDADNQDSEKAPDVKLVTVEDFKFKKCGKIPEMADVARSAAEFGIVYLTNDETQSCWYGFNCPTCEKPWLNIRKFKHKEIFQFARNIGLGFRTCRCAKRRRAVLGGLIVK